MFHLWQVAQPRLWRNHATSLICRIFRFHCETYLKQGGITCEAIDEPGKPSKAIDKRVIINFRDKNVAIARFRDKNEVFV